MHFIIRKYELDFNEKAIKRCFVSISQKLGEENVLSLLEDFVNKFPTADFYKTDKTAKEYLDEVHNGKTNKEIIFEEILLNYFNNINPANRKIKFLFNSDIWRKRYLYVTII